VITPGAEMRVPIASFPFIFFLPFFFFSPVFFFLSFFFLIRSPVRANFDPGNDARGEIAFLIVRPGS
jgi:hypothetical protein